jgi:hypothetical protein
MSILKYVRIKRKKKKVYLTTQRVSIYNLHFYGYSTHLTTPMIYLTQLLSACKVRNKIEIDSQTWLGR